MDFHFQNVVAAGEHPVAVDLESLFHPTLPAAPFSRPGERLAARALGDSVLRVGMLPFRVSETEGGRQDWSGVASVAGQTSPDPMLEWERAGTDEMHAVKRLLPMKGARNRPTIDGREAEAADHREAIVAGFERTHRLLTEHKGALLAPDGPLERCADATSRVVLRTTRGYALMLDESWHPDFMRDALDRDRFLDRLWVGSDDMPAWRRAAAHDHRDLWREDIPWYGARPESRDLWTSTGERLPQFFPESGLEWSRRRLHEMDDDDRLRQSWLARSALDTLLLHSERAEPAGYALDEADASRGDGMRSRLIEQAVKLGEWFERTAFRDGSDLIWIALDMRDGFWSLYPCSEDLYSGVPGIALFLAHLGWVSDQERFVSLARRGMTTLLEKLEAAPGQVPFIGLYQGWGSAIAALAHVGAVTGDEATLVAAERLVPRVGERIEHDRVLDVVGGAAGAIAALLALHRVSASSAALEAAMRGGEHLLASARRSAHGVFWLTELGGDEPLSGFAHGASGIAAALSRLAIATGDRRFLEAALVGLAFEREAMRATAGSDRVGIRDATHTRFEPGTWCYGAPGTGFARLTALDAIEALDPRNEHRAALRADVDEAIAITLEHGFGRSHCLCHGDLGNLDFLIEAERRLPDRALRIPIDQITSSVLADCSRHGWRCGTAAGLVSPALMNGLAGIGYGLLRVADPERIPSVLAMEPPRTARPAVVVNA
jgi:type 2 lantibiotic biosynthesis protein LanM